MYHGLEIVKNLVTLLSRVVAACICLLVFFHLHCHLRNDLVYVVINVFHDDLKPLGSRWVLVLLRPILLNLLVEVCVLELLEAVPEFADLILRLLLLGDLVLHETGVLREVAHPVPHVALAVDGVGEHGEGQRRSHRDSHMHLQVVVLVLLQRGLGLFTQLPALLKNCFLFFSLCCNILRFKVFSTGVGVSKGEQQLQEVDLSESFLINLHFAANRIEPFEVQALC